MVAAHLALHLLAAGEPLGVGPTRAAAQRPGAVVVVWVAMSPKGEAPGWGEGPAWVPVWSVPVYRDTLLAITPLAEKQEAEIAARFWESEPFVGSATEKGQRETVGRYFKRVD